MKESFTLHGRSIRIARLLKGVSVKELGELTGINPNYVAIIERNEGTISHRNYFRFLRALRRDLGFTDQQLVAISILVENIEEVEKGALD
ncbi:helix-turn-helix domain-containing protein [Virgibacillus halodenitrificans]|uniref:helix-turn-helix domain-containing protein n=1 Tax=Virgibacillus halodenitrificans TaxID=1482 RepID=UPI00136DD397|nr:helix-turn-helix transcriptional regulator [Virgibacillus halodenitrificans]MYL44400.1 helix-turn-helix domain-containing protein [Virgibacillus halodenitrificans]